MKYWLLSLSMFICFQGLAQERTPTADPLLPVALASGNLFSKSGFATYYHRKFEGRRTASGERYRGAKLTAAHKTLPFGTIVTVTNLSSGKSVEVEINDRGPFSKKYMIDVSEAAAKELGFYKKGHSQVEISYALPVE